MLHCAMFSVIALVNFNVSSLHPTRKCWLKLIVVRIWFPQRSPDLRSRFVTLTRLSAMSIYVSSQLLTHMLSTTLYNIINTYLYKILINKSNKISYITMSMPLLYNIEYCNNIVAIQCSVSMYTDTWHSILWWVYLQSPREADITWSRKHVHAWSSLW